MPNLYFFIARQDGDASITCYIPGAAMESATDSHPNFERIVAGALADDVSVFDLFDTAKVAAAKFEALTDRIAVRNGIVYLDSDEVHSVLTSHIVRFLDEGVDDWKPLVAFFENVLANPNDHSREQLYDWLDRHEFTITQDGLIVGYKGVRASSVDGVDYESCTAGPGIVDGQEYNGHLPNNIGSTVEIARSRVNHDPAVGCSTGLHVGNYGYAAGFGSVLLEVHVDPRDVVSVPTDCNWAKVRCCRYKVVGLIQERITTAVQAARDEDDLDRADKDGLLYAIGDVLATDEGDCVVCDLDPHDEDGLYYLVTYRTGEPGSEWEDWISDEEVTRQVG